MHENLGICRRRIDHAGFVEKFFPLSYICTLILRILREKMRVSIINDMEESLIVMHDSPNKQFAEHWLLAVNESNISAYRITKLKWFDFILDPTVYDGGVTYLKIQNFVSMNELWKCGMWLQRPK
jgi:hypothetical protein